MIYYTKAWKQFYMILKLLQIDPHRRQDPTKDILDLLQQDQDP